MMARPKPDRQGGQPADGRGAVVALQAEGDGDDRAVLGADDHGADDQDGGVGQDPDGADQGGQGQQGEKAGRVDGVGADLRLHEVPDRLGVAVVVAAVRAVEVAGPDLGVDGLDGDRAELAARRLRPGGGGGLELAEAAQHRVRGRAGQVELDGVAGRLAGGAGQHDQVDDAGAGRQQAEHACGQGRRAGYAHMQHRGIVTGRSDPRHHPWQATSTVRPVRVRRRVPVPGTLTGRKAWSGQTGQGAGGRTARPGQAARSTQERRPRRLRRGAAALRPGDAADRPGVTGCCCSC